MNLNLSLYSPFRRMYIKNETYAEIIVFLYRKMAEEKRGKMLGDKDFHVLQYFLGAEASPQRNLFFRLLQAMIERQRLSVYELAVVIHKILNNLRNSTDGTDKDFYFRAFRCAWEGYAQNFQTYLTFGQGIHCQLVKDIFVLNLYDMFHIKGLKLILEDERVKAIRPALINQGFRKFEQLILEENFRALENFVREIFHLKVERKRFKSCLNYCAALEMKGLSQTANELSEWIMS